MKTFNVLKLIYQWKISVQDADANELKHLKDYILHGPDVFWIRKSDSFPKKYNSVAAMFNTSKNIT